MIQNIQTVLCQEIYLKILLPVWNMFWLRVVKGYTLPLYKLLQKIQDKYGNLLKILLPDKNPTGRLAPRRHHNFHVCVNLNTTSTQPQHNLKLNSTSTTSQYQLNLNLSLNSTSAKT